MLTRAVLSSQCILTAKELRLDEFRVSANDLMTVWRRREDDAFETLDEMLISAERIAFYLRSPESKGIKLPRAWMMSQLDKGMFAEPVGFESREVKQERLQNEAQVVKAKRAAAHVVEQADQIENEQHHRNKARLASLNEVERRRLLRGAPVSSIYSHVADAILMETLASEAREERYAA